MRAISYRLWQGAFCLFAVLSLAFMAGMSIGAGLFLLSTIFALYAGWGEWGRESLRAVARHPWTWLTGAFFLVASLSLVVAHFWPVVPDGPRGLGELKKFHHLLYPPLIAIALLRGLRGVRFEEHAFWKFWLGMGAFSALLATIQYFGADLFPEPWLAHRFFRRVGISNRFHGQGLMFFHLSFASCMCFVASAAGARAIWPLAGERTGRRWLWVAYSLFAAAAVYFSFSRISILALLLLFVTLGYLRRPIWGLVTTIVLILFSVGVWQFSPTLQYRWEASKAGNAERMLMWESAVAMFRDRPVTGVGFSRTGALSPVYAKRLLDGGQPQWTSHVHNNFLDALASTGLLGAGIFLAWWGWIFVAAGRAFREAKPGERWLPAAAIAGFVAFHANGLTQINFWDGKSQHTLMIWVGVVLALDLRRRARKA